MANLESLPAELIAEIALMYRHPSAILRLMTVSKRLHAAIGGQYKCKEVLAHARMFKNVINEIKQCILYVEYSDNDSYIYYANDPSVLNTISDVYMSYDVNYCFTYEYHNSILETSYYSYIKDSDDWKMTRTWFDLAYNGYFYTHVERQILQ
jgi:hypothetical protein